jgi:hypothetical protein
MPCQRKSTRRQTNREDTKPNRTKRETMHEHCVRTPTQIISEIVGPMRATFNPACASRPFQPVPTHCYHAGGWKNLTKPPPAGPIITSVCLLDSAAGISHRRLTHFSLTLRTEPFASPHRT